MKRKSRITSTLNILEILLNAIRLKGVFHVSLYDILGNQIIQEISIRKVENGNDYHLTFFPQKIIFAGNVVSYYRKCISSYN